MQGTIAYLQKTAVLFISNSNAFPFSDARYLVAGGKSRFLHLWSLDSSKLIRVIEMPAKVKVIRQLEFLPDSYQKGVDQVSVSLRILFDTISN